MEDAVLCENALLELDVFCLHTTVVDGPVLSMTQFNSKVRRVCVVPQSSGLISYLFVSSAVYTN